jgi:AraC-like DNA-binding protein
MGVLLRQSRRSGVEFAINTTKSSGVRPRATWQPHLASSQSGAPRPPSFRLSEIGHHAEFEAWSLALDGLFDTAGSLDEIAKFTGSIEARTTRQVMLSCISGAPVRLVRSPATIARSGLNHFCVWLIAEGFVSGIVAGERFCGNAGDLLFFDLQQTAELQLSPAGTYATCFALWIPRPTLLSLVNDEQALHGLVLKGTTPAGALIGANLRALAASAEQMTSKELDVLAGGVLTLIAKSLVPALPTTAASATSMGPNALVLITRFIDRHLGSNELNAEMLARQFGLSRASLYRLFVPVGGVAEYIRGRRLNRAYQEIVDAEFSTCRISQIGFRLGFRNISNFSRTFRHEFGMSPRQARDAALSGHRHMVGPMSPKPGASIAYFLAQVDSR